MPGRSIVDLAALAEWEREERALAVAARTEAARRDHEAVADCYRAAIRSGLAGQAIAPLQPKRGPGPKMADWL